MKEEKKKQLSEAEEKLRKKKEAQEAEKLAILSKADEIKEETFDFDVDGTIELKNEVSDMVLDAIDDPEEKYQLYYNVLNRMLQKALPKGEENKEARDFIYEEKNTFLSGGHRKNKAGIRGGDGRMGYRTDMHEIINVVTEWIASRGGMFDLYVKLRALNIEKGYGDPLNNK